MYAECLAILDASALSIEDRTLWSSVLMRNPMVVHAYFVRVFSDAPELLPDATTELRLTVRAKSDPTATEALIAHERTVLARA
jgi:hypothetical protein